MNTHKLARIIELIGEADILLRVNRKESKKGFQIFLYNAWLHLNMPRYKFADILGVDKSTISKWFLQRANTEIPKVYIQKTRDLLMKEKEKILMDNDNV